MRISPAKVPRTGLEFLGLGRDSQPIWSYSNSDSERPPALILRKVLMGKMIKMGTSGGSRYTAGTQGLLRFCSRKPIVFFPAIHVTNFFEFVLLG